MLVPVRGHRRTRLVLPRSADRLRMDLSVAGCDLSEGARVRAHRVDCRHNRHRGQYQRPARDSGSRSWRVRVRLCSACEDPQDGRVWSAEQLGGDAETAAVRISVTSRPSILARRRPVAGSVSRMEARYVGIPSAAFPRDERDHLQAQLIPLDRHDSQRPAPVVERGIWRKGWITACTENAFNAAPSRR